MIYSRKYSFISGIVIKKIKYKDYHEIINVFTENGKIESFFYKNFYKDNKKININIPVFINIFFYNNIGLKKIFKLEPIKHYNDINYDINKYIYIENIIELIFYFKNSNKEMYILFCNILNDVNQNKINPILASIFFILQFLKKDNFTFKYKKTKNFYIGYSFIHNMFLDQKNDSLSFYEINDKLVKYIYLIFTSEYNTIKNIKLNNNELLIIYKFINIILLEYSGINLKSYKKILELENFLKSI